MLLTPEAYIGANDIAASLKTLSIRPVAANPSPKQPCNFHAMAKIQLVRVAHVYYKFRDLKKADTFLGDFGFNKIKSDEQRIYYRGTGPEPFVYCAQQAEENEFGGAAFVVESSEDLKLASALPNATPIRKLDGPGGGKIVTVREPNDNIPFHFVFGQAKAPELESTEERPFNFVRFHHRASLFCVLITLQPRIKHRTAGQFQRFEKGKKPSSLGFIYAHPCRSMSRVQARPFRGLCDGFREVISVLHGKFQLRPQRRECAFVYSDLLILTL